MFDLTRVGSNLYSYYLIRIYFLHQLYLFSQRKIETWSKTKCVPWCPTVHSIFSYSCISDNDYSSLSSRQQLRFATIDMAEYMRPPSSHSVTGISGCWKHQKMAERVTRCNVREHSRFKYLLILDSLQFLVMVCHQGGIVEKDEKMGIHYHQLAAICEVMKHQNTTLVFTDRRSM